MPIENNITEKVAIPKQIKQEKKYNFPVDIR